MNTVLKYTTNQLSSQPKVSGVTIVTCCMNRNDNLNKALKSWLKLKEVSEIIIVDWSSEISVKKTIPFHEKIKIVEVPNQKQWILSHAFNVGINFVSTNKLLKLDADIIASDQLLNNHKLHKNNFYHGTWKNAKTFDQIHINGQLYCFTNDFWKVNGYNEQITSYGWDDDDLYERLIKSNLNESFLNSNDLHHIHTPNKDRVEFQSEFANKEINHDILVASRNKNREHCRKNSWSTKNKRINYIIKTYTDNHFICERIK